MPAYSFLKKVIPRMFCLLAILPVYSQNSDKPKNQYASFSHLNTSVGLTDNNVLSIAVDKKGYLWMGTPDGLNVFDGYTITNYTREENPELASDNVIHLTLDKNNLLWLGTPNGVTTVDERRNFKRIRVNDTVERYGCRTIMETVSYGNVLVTNLGQFYFDKKKNSWKKIEWIPELLNYPDFMDAEPFNEDQVLYCMDSSVTILDYKTRKLIYQKDIVDAVSACRVNHNQIAIGLGSGVVKVVDINSDQLICEYKLTNHQNGKIINTPLTEVRRAASGELIVATGVAGLFTIDSAGHVTRHSHDPLNPGSIATNTTFRVLAGINGEIIVGTSTAGASIYNINYQRAGAAKIFRDANGNLFDGLVNDIVEDREGYLWIGAYDRLIKWDKEHDQSEFFFYYSNSPESGVRSMEITALSFDRAGRLWSTIFNDALAIFDPATKKFQKIDFNPKLGKAMESKYVNDLMLHSDGTMWGCTNTGLFAVNPQTLAFTTFEDDSILKMFAGKRILNVYQDRLNRIWIGTVGDGVYRYDPVMKAVKHFTPSGGLGSRTGYAMLEDRRGYIYVASPSGFSVIDRRDSIKIYNRENGLRYLRTDGFLEDEMGNVWIANNKCLVKFDPVRKTMTQFDENAGLSINGFRSASCHKTRKGELLWGSQSGINYFFAGQLLNNATPLQVNIFQASLRDSAFRLANADSLKIPYASNNITFEFTAINLSAPRKIQYQYILEGYDKEWQNVTDIRQARYSALPAGKYTFKVKASIDGRNWTAAGNEVFLQVITPVWQRWWFVLLLMLGMAGIIYGAFQIRLNQLSKQQKIKTEYNKRISEIEMKALRAQMNPHFIFNCLNSINRYIVKSDHATASLYLTRFSKLIRLILDNSNSKNVLLSNELEALKLYIEMESLRFDNKFTYTIKVDDDVIPDSIEVPPLIIQPYVENAIWHGLLHKETNGHLGIDVTMIGDNMLQCIVEDNGVGREKAKEFRSKSATSKKSLGMKLTEDRISILNKHASLNASVHIIDKQTGIDANGTKVIIRIPV